ncbi:MAG: UDP-N-acetylmuramate dehydrogenase [Clostridia bacterium]|nr:UDP-N-acetylmuramate dehydrogenase [Clostridia bacterium]
MSDKTLISALSLRLQDAGIRIMEELPLSRYTTFHIGGSAALAAFPETPEQLCEVLTACAAAGIPCAVVGNGSNLLCDDEGFAGCVLLTTAMKVVSVSGTSITAQAGASLAAVCTLARDHGLAGLTFAYGIPGSVGGAVYMNAGAYDGEVGDRITSVTYYDIPTGEIRTVPASDCGFGYRTSRFQKDAAVILSAEFALDAGDNAVIRAEMEDILFRRRDKQPLEYPSAGSAFKRYPGYFTAKLIDEAGFKGYCIGGAQVSEKHAGFIINRGGATAADVRTLIDEIRERIHKEHNIWIEPEIRGLADCVKA